METHEFRVTIVGFDSRPDPHQRQQTAREGLGSGGQWEYESIATYIRLESFFSKWMETMNVEAHKSSWVAFLREWSPAQVTRLFKESGVDISASFALNWI